MSRPGRADAISFFLTPVGVLKSSGGNRHVPEAERDAESYKNFDLKSRLFFGKVPQTDIFYFSKKYSTFEQGSIKKYFLDVITRWGEVPEVTKQEISCQKKYIFTSKNLMFANIKLNMCYFRDHHELFSRPSSFSLGGRGAARSLRGIWRNRDDV